MNSTLTPNITTTIYLLLINSNKFYYFLYINEY